MWADVDMVVTAFLIICVIGNGRKDLGNYSIGSKSRCRNYRPYSIRLNWKLTLFLSLFFSCVIYGIYSIECLFYYY